MKSVRGLVLLALLTSQAIVLSIVESWIPVYSPVPGIKLGLANIITVVVISLFGFWDAFAVMVTRTIISSIYTGGLNVFLFSFAGGLLSTVAMWIAYKKLSKVLSTSGISILGAVFHNVGQIIVASIMVKDTAIFFTYLPILMMTGILTGLFIGLCSEYLKKLLLKSKAINSLNK